MPNVHMQEAARNLQKAMSDLDLKETQIQAEKENHKRAIDEQINVIKNRQNMLNVALRASSDGINDAVMRAEIIKLDNDISDLSKQKFKIEDDFRKQFSELEKNKSQIKQVSDLIQGLA